MLAYDRTETGYNPITGEWAPPPKYQPIQPSTNPVIQRVDPGMLVTASIGGHAYLPFDGESEANYILRMEQAGLSPAAARNNYAIVMAAMPKPDVPSIKPGGSFPQPVKAGFGLPIMLALGAAAVMIFIVSKRPKNRKRRK
jgi:hypothetical protein